jgi:type III secretion protein V
MPAAEFLARLDADEQNRILRVLDVELGNTPPTAQTPTVLTKASVRPILRKLIAPVYPRVAVLCYQELALDLNIQPIARIGFDDDQEDLTWR